MANIELCFLTENEIEEIASSFAKIGWKKPVSLYEKYLKDQQNNLRIVVLAKVHENFAGYVTLKWKSEYPHFLEKNIPEISDLNVLPEYRKNGIGTRLIKKCEQIAKEQKHKEIGIGVGLTADYGDAQRLYIRLGYLPDGRGLYYKNISVRYSELVKVDDDLILYLSKKLQSK